MADQDKPKGPPDKKKKLSPEDLEKTTLDINLRDYDLEDEETVMVKLPKEDSDLHDAGFYEKEEITGDHEIPEAKEKVSKKDKAKPAKEKPREAAEPAKAPPKKEKLPPAFEESSVMIRVRPPFSLVYTILALAFFLILAEGILEVLGRGISLRLPAIISGAFAVLVLLGTLLRRWEGKKGFLWILVAWFGLITYAGLKFYTSDAQSLHFFKISLENLLGPVLFIIAAIVPLMLWRERKIPRLLKLISWIPAVLLIIAWGLGFWQGRSLEDSLWGPGFLSGLPLFLRPGVLALGLAFSLDVFLLLFLFFFQRMRRKGFLRAPGLPLLILSLMGVLLGAKLLARQGFSLPLIGNWVQSDFYANTVVDPQGSSLRLQIAKGKVSFDHEVNYLEAAASDSTLTGSSRKSQLMVRNGEGRSFVIPLDRYIILTRGDKRISGAKAVLDTGKLGLDRHLVVMVNLPALVETQVKTSLESALHRLAHQLRGKDSITLVTPSGTFNLNAKNAGSWPATLGKALVPDGADPQGLLDSGIKKLKSLSGVKGMFLIEAAKDLPQENIRSTWAAEVKKVGASLQLLAYGETAPLPGIYGIVQPSSFGFQMLSAAAGVLGDYTLQYPDLPPLPKIVLARDTAGHVVQAGGKISFQVTASDPGMIKTLQLKVDQENPVDLEVGQLNPVVDLARLKLKSGSHRFEILLTTPSGDVVREVFEGEYITKVPLAFMKPLDKDTVSGSFNVVLSGGRVQGLQTTFIDLLVDGVKIGSSTTEPYSIALDTSRLSEGVHQLSTTQFYSDGSSETAQIQINVNQQTPPIKIVRPSTGEYLDNLAQIEAEIGGGLLAQVQSVQFLVDGEWLGESLKAPYKFLWANNGYPPGKYYLQARAQYGAGFTNTDAVQVQLGQGELVVQANPADHPNGRLFPENVEVLVDASQSMNGPLGNAIKFDLAKSALSELFQTLPSQVHWSVRLYGEGSQAMQKNCRDSYLLKNPGAQLAGLMAKGTSPLAYALSQTERDFKKAQGSRVGLLITDGWDKCGQDPIEVATRLSKQVARLRLHVIYFGDVDAATESLLKRLAEVTGGRIYKVSRPEELREAIRDAVQVNFSLSDYKKTPVLEQPLSETPYEVRSGEYQLQIDTVPPIVKEGVMITTGSKKTFTVYHQEGKDELKEE